MRKEYKDYNRIWAILLAVQLLLLIFMITKVVDKGGEYDKSSIVNVSMVITCSVIAMAVLISILRIKRKSREEILFISLVFVANFYLLSDMAFHIVNGVQELRIINILINAVYLVCPVLMIYQYWLSLNVWTDTAFADYPWMNKAVISLTWIQVVLIIGDVFFEYYSVVTSEGYYERGRLFLLTLIFPLLVIFICIWRLLRIDIPAGERLALLAYPSIPMIAYMVQLFIPKVQILTSANFVSIMIIYTNYFIKKERELEHLSRELTISQLRTLQMQINPHLLYNTLTSVAALCEIDAEKAQEMTYLLADYMRDSFTDIEKPSLVSFREEVEQLGHYLSIEAIRFPNITVEKDIQCSDFSIPRMSVQPLVENAINHGIRKRRNSEGTIKISSRETDTSWIVEVVDNGVGFDSSSVKETPKGHFGIANVRTRLQILCGGDVKVNSIPGEGTISVITIPKSKKGGGTTERPKHRINKA